VSLDSTTALFVLIGQTAERAVEGIDDLVPKDRLILSESYDIAPLLPKIVRRASEAAESYRLFFTFENFLREFVVEVLSKDPAVSW
jgi:hypothetical protein